MKKAILILFVVIGSYACTKDVKSCWECKFSSQSDTAYHDFGCDKTKAEVDKLTQGKEYTDFEGNYLGYQVCRRK